MNLPTLNTETEKKSQRDSSDLRSREVAYEHNRNFVRLLEQLGLSLAISTYQAGKLLTVSASQGKLLLSLHNFERPMGIAVRPDRIAVATQHQVWFLSNARDIAPQIQPTGQYDACFLARTSHFTGNIRAHELAWEGDRLWIVNTLFSCLCTLDGNYSFVPRWKPPFVTELAAEDRCHLNGLAFADGKPKYVSVLGETDTPQGWRPHKESSGCLIDVSTGQTIARGFAMPHSPRIFAGHVWLLDSGRGRLLTVDPTDGKSETVAELPGYARGLAFYKGIAFVGLSKIRETSVFGEIPIAEDLDKLECGVVAVDLATGRPLASLTFQSGVEEIFDVRVLPGIRCPSLSGPFADQEAAPAIWSVPLPNQEE